MDALRFSLLIAISFVLAACGYSLRGTDLQNGSVLQDSLQNLQLELQNPNSEFARLLRRSLQGAGANLLEGESGSTHTRLAVSDIRVENRAVSVNPAARAAQYELRLSVDIMATRSNIELIPQQTLSVERSYFEDIENIAGNQEEVEIITDEMRRELINLLLRRLQAPADSV